MYENVNSGFYVHRVEAVDLDAQPRLQYSLDPHSSEARNEEGSIVKVRLASMRRGLYIIIVIKVDRSIDTRQVLPRPSKN